MTIYLNPPQQRPGPMAGFGQGAQVLSNAFQNAELNKVLEDATQNPDMTQQDVMKMLFAAPNMSPQMKMQGAAALQKLFPEKAPVNLQQITGTGQSFNPRTNEARDIPGYKPPPKDADEANWVNVPGYPGIIRNTLTNETKTLEDLPANQQIKQITEEWWDSSGIKNEKTFENPTAKDLNDFRTKIRSEGGTLGKPSKKGSNVVAIRKADGTLGWKEKGEAFEPGETILGKGRKTSFTNKKGTRIIRNILDNSKQAQDLMAKGWTEGTLTGTEEERTTAENITNLPDLVALAKEDPNKAYESGWRMNDDGAVFTDPISGAPQKLRPADKVLGKRGLPKQLMMFGEMHDDAVEILDLMDKPEVKQAFGRYLTESGGFAGIVASGWRNKLRRWLTENGYGENSDVSEVVHRMQLMASIERKEKLGVAMPKQELSTVLGWLPSSGDNYEEIMSKMGVIEAEAKEKFMRYIDVNKDVGNMSPYYKAFGMQRFKNNGTISEDDIKAIFNKYSLE